MSPPHQNLIPRLRRAAFEKQGGLCHYCKKPIWEADPRSFAQQHKLSQKQAAQMQCTAEHLRPRSEGGPDTPCNIVAACWFCNHKRHFHRRTIDHQPYLEHVRQRCAKGKWTDAFWSKSLQGGKIKPMQTTLQSV